MNYLHFFIRNQIYNFTMKIRIINYANIKGKENYLV